MKDLALFLLSVFLLFFAGVPVRAQNCSSHVTPFDTVQSAIDELTRGQNCLNRAIADFRFSQPNTGNDDLEPKIQKLQKKIEQLESDHTGLETEVNNLQDKLTQLELRLSTAETKLRTAEQTIRDLQWESSLQVPRHPAKPAVSKPKAAGNKPEANKPKIDDWQDVATPRSSKPNGKKPVPTVDQPKDD